MSKIISVIGNVGVGKTTLTKVLSSKFNFINMSEQHSDRPFQKQFAENGQNGLANQVDYLLLRAEQEREIRISGQIGIFDGGLDLDFHVFTKLFYSRGLLNRDELDLCQKLYDFYRKFLRAPDLTIYLVADQNVIRDRFRARGRINVARSEDMREINVLLENYYLTIPVKKRLKYDSTNCPPDFPEIIDLIKKVINKL